MSTKHIPTILIVDDAPENIDILREILRNQYKIKISTNGKHALEIVRKDPSIDLILLDVMMPGMDGYEVCRILKDNDKTARIPVLFITAESSVENEEHAFMLGAVDYILKPFNPVIVQSRVKAHMHVALEAKRLYEDNLRLKQQIEGSFHNFTEDELLTMIENGESDSLEFKSTLRTNLHTGKPDKKIENSVLKTIAAFLNSSGGILLIGVDDNGTPLGLSQDHFSNVDRLILHLSNLIKDHLGVDCAQFIRITIHTITSLPVLVVEVIPSDKPVFFTRDNDEIFYIRLNNSTQQLKPREIITYIEKFSR